MPGTSTFAASASGPFRINRSRGHALRDCACVALVVAAMAVFLAQALGS